MVRGRTLPDDGGLVDLPQSIGNSVHESVKSLLDIDALSLQLLLSLRVIPVAVSVDLVTAGAEVLGVEHVGSGLDELLGEVASIVGSDTQLAGRRL